MAIIHTASIDNILRALADPTRRDRVAAQVPERPMQRWSLDFMSDQLADQRRFRILNIVDDHSRFCPGQIIDLSISGVRVARYLDELAAHFGLPQETR